jgi:hypothetical protein
VSDHYHYEYAEARHDHRGQYADERHEHYREYAEYRHDHDDLGSLIAGLREDLRHAEERIRELEDDRAGVLAQLRVLDRLRPSCVICHDGAADRQTARGPACTDCVGDLPDGGPDPDFPETWAFDEVNEDQADEGAAAVRERAYIERRVIQAALASSGATREDVARTVAAARQEWQAASNEERAGLMRAAEEAIDPWHSAGDAPGHGPAATEDYQRGQS